MKRSQNRKMKCAIILSCALFVMLGLFSLPDSFVTFNQVTQNHKTTTSAQTNQTGTPQESPSTISEKGTVNEAETSDPLPPDPNTSNASSKPTENNPLIPSVKEVENLHSADLNQEVASALDLMRKAIDQLSLATPETRAAIIAQLRHAENEMLRIAEKKAIALGWPLTINDGQAKIAGLDSNGTPYYSGTQNSNAAISVDLTAARLKPAFSGLTGSGMIIGKWDVGRARGTHQSFAGRLLAKDTPLKEDFDSHATHVAGTMISSSALGIATEGMAPAATLWSYDWINDLSEMLAAAAATEASANDSSALMISNHSYGRYCGWVLENLQWIYYGSTALGSDPAFGKYDLSARALDEACRSSPYYLPFFAAGNERGSRPAPGNMVKFSPTAKAVKYDPLIHPLGDDANGGYDTLSPRYTAKNIITVGALNDAVSNGVRDINVSISGFSSFGPPDDGRVKPDIVANGVSLLSAGISSDTATTTKSGTSMASPSAAGATLLLQQYYKQRFNKPMRADMLKVLLLHTADDLGNIGPDYIHGWGLMNVNRALELIKSAADSPSAPILRNNFLTSPSKPVHNYSIQATGVPIKVTICWTDPAGAESSASTLNDRTPNIVNDLDLTLLNSNGQVVARPWRLNPDSPSSPATTGDNTVDNVEQIILNPPPGSYTVRISHKGVLTGPNNGTGQTFAIAISGSQGLGIDPTSIVVNGIEPTLEIPVGKRGQQGHIRVRNSGGGTLAFSVSSNQSWLVPAVTSGSSTGQDVNIPVTLATENLSIGKHTATLTITPTSPFNLPPVTRKVTVQITGTSSVHGALDSFGLTFSQGGTGQPFHGISGTSAGSVDSDHLASGDATQGQESWIETTVNGSGVLIFKSKLNSLSGDRLLVTVNGQSRLDININHDWTIRNLPLGSGSHTIRISRIKGNALPQHSDELLLDDLKFGITPSLPNIPELFIEGSKLIYEFAYTGDVTDWSVSGLPGSYSVITQYPGLARINWSNISPGDYTITITGTGSAGSSATTFSLRAIEQSGFSGPDFQGAYTNPSDSSRWVTVSSPSHDGIDSAQSGNITHNQSSTFSFRADGPGQLKWWWKSSTEFAFDTVFMKINGQELAFTSGIHDWIEISVTVPPGKDHLCEFTYQKSSSISEGLDKVWVDQLQFLPAPIVLTEGTTEKISPDKFGWPINRPLYYKLHIPGAVTTASVNQLPPGLVFTPSTQTVTGTPTVAGDYSSTFSFSGPAGSNTFTVDWHFEPFIGLKEATDSPDLSWSTTFSGWFGLKGFDSPFDDNDMCIRSPIIGEGQSTFAEVILPGPGIVSFDYLLLSNTPDDGLQILKDGTPVSTQFSATGFWQTRSFSFDTPGPHTLRFVYSKNSDGLVGGQDGVWIDRVRFSPYPEYAGEESYHCFQNVPWLKQMLLSQPDAYAVFLQNLPPGLAIQNEFTPPSILSGTPTGEGEYLTKFRVSKKNQSADVIYEDFPITVHPSTTTVAGIDWTLFLSYPVTTGGDASWFGQFLDSADGIDAARSGFMLSNGTPQQSWIQFTAPGNCLLKWKWKTDCEPDWDLFHVTIDGEQYESITGDSGWVDGSALLGEGAHVIRFTYEKNGDVDSGQDAAWLDQIEILFPPSPTGPGGLALNVGETSSTPITGTNLVGVTWKATGLPPGMTISSRGQLLGAPVTAGVFDAAVTATNAAGSTSHTITIAVQPTALVEVAADTAQPLTWTSPRGNRTWFGQSLVTNDGIDALQSAFIQDSTGSGDDLVPSESIAILNIQEAGILNFKYRVDSQAGHDFFIIRRNGAEILRKSGFIDWKSHTIELQPGSNAIEFIYSKDGDGTSGADAAWIDNVIFTPGAVPPPLSINLLAINPSQPRERIIEFQSRLGRKYTAESSPDLLEWEPFGDELIGDGGIMSFTHTLPTRIPAMRFYRVGEEIPEEP